MKPIIPFALLGALFAVGAAKAAVTDPVGYITHTISGAGVSPSALTLISPTLTQPIAYAGQSTETPSGGSVITLPTGVPTTLDESYVLEITSGASAGWWATVDMSTATTITVVSPFPSGLPANVSISVRKHSTIGNFLGANKPGLLPFDGENPNDEVQFLNPVGPVQSVKTFVWITTEGGGPGWYDLAGEVFNNDFVIEPGTAVAIKRVGTGSLTFTSEGDVKITPTQVDVFTNINWVGTPLATGGTLNGMTFNTQLVLFDGEAPNFDELQKISPPSLAGVQSVSTFVALDGDGLGNLTMYDLAGEADAGTEPFDEGEGVIIKRIGSANGTITIPGTVVTE